MNKSYLIAGGASVVSLAAGAAGGYLFAKKKFDVALEEQVRLEVEATKKYYAVRLMEAKKPDNPGDLLADPEVEKEENTGDDEKLIGEDAEKIIQKGKTALMNYQGVSATTPASEVVENNIFDVNKRPKKALPPREPGTGKFLPKSTEPDPEPRDKPYLISAESFLLNTPEHEQDSLYYYAKDDTVVMASDISEAIDPAKIGQENLSSFPEDEDPGVIYVRHDILQVDYQITRTYESLTEAMGLGETDEDIDHEDEYVYQD